MLIFDLINDEAPLFAGAVKYLFENDILKKENVIGVSEGNRWEKDVLGISCINRLHFFDDLDKKEIDIKNEIERISNTYDNFNIYACDRNLIKKNRGFQEKILVYTYLFYEDLFKKGATKYFTTGIAYSYNLISFQVSKRYNVQHISFYGIRLKNRTAISYGVNNSFDEIKELYDKYSPDRVTEDMYVAIDEFINRPKQPMFMKNAINSFTLRKVFITEFFKRSKEYYFKGKHKYDLFTGTPYQLSLFKLKKIAIAKKINLLHDSIFDDISEDDNYFLFPMHMQPEASTLILAPFQLDQKAAIINISKLLPPNTKLYVKEHRSALGQHSVSFYKELKRYPNIKVISYRVNTFELIKKAKGTINLSSTVGLESLIFKIPSIVLGNVFYNDTNMTFKAKSYVELKQVIDTVNNKDFSVSNFFKDYEARIAYYIYCLKQRSYPFEFNVAKMDVRDRVLKPSNIKGFAKCLHDVINKSYQEVH